MNPITYRFATPADIPALVKLRIAFLHETAPNLTPQPALAPALERYFSATLPTGEFLACLALDGTTVIATSGLVFRRNPPSIRALNGTSAYVMNMYTLPAHRNRGIAAALLQKLIDHARQQKCRHISLHTMPQARTLYAKLGFTPTDSEMRLNLNCDA